MKTFGKLLIPLGLGCLAFALNFLAVQPQLGHDFVTVSEDVKVDQPLDESQLTKFKVVGDNFEHLKKTLVPWEERAALLGLPVRRELRSGDFVFWQDVRYLSADFLAGPDEIPLHVSLEGVDYEPSLLKVGNLIGLIVPVVTAPAGPNDPQAATAPQLFDELNAKFEELGPFRILSVGQRTLEAPGEADPENQQQGNSHLVTLAVKIDASAAGAPTAAADGSNPSGTSAKNSLPAAGSRTVPEAARKLLAAKNASRADGKNFVAMVLYQDVDKLRRLREFQAQESSKSKPAASQPDGAAGGS